MKPNAVAPVLRTQAGFRIGSLVLLSLSLLMLLFAGAASALDGIDLSAPAEEVAEGECPQLIQIKYPFLSCANGQIETPDESATWAETRRIPLGEAWTEGFGYWGPTLNDPNSDEF